MKSVIKMWVAGAGLMLALPVLASGSGPKMAEGVNYIPLTPALVVNYGGPGNKPRYIKVELSVRAENAEDATEVMHHLPLIRDRMISILSAQTEESISTPEGKEYVRLYALSEINKALLQVEGHSVDGHGDDNHGSAGHSKTGGNAKTSAISDAGHAEEAKSAVPSLADLKPVKGPASDLFFNNFVVQK